MRLAAIYNLWCGEELLPGSIACIRDHIDHIIIVYQEVSNYGEARDPVFYLEPTFFNDEKITFINYRWNPSLRPRHSEIAKRNLGLESARLKGCTHFLHMDTDEFYEDFGAAKKLYEDRGAAGSVCRLHTYFKKPTWRLEVQEGYFVPFIHELHAHTRAGEREYPYYVDPTRRINESDVKEIPIDMHHFSWVRKNITRKANNSTAKANIEAGTLMQEYGKCTGPGYYVEAYKSKLIEVPDTFNLSPIFK